MEVLYPHCAGLDVRKDTVVACVRHMVNGTVKREVRTFKTTTTELLSLSDWLATEKCTHIAMEATGVYWKPVWHILNDADFALVLANAAHVKNVPGRKTDVNDATWLADLLAHGLIRGSFVPDQQTQKMRDLQFALLAVARVAEARQLAAAAFEPGRGDVVEHQRPVFEVAARERGLDRVLARAEPVERAIELDLVDRSQPQQPAQARAGGGDGQLARGSELGGGRDQPAGNQRHCQRRQALVGRLAEQPVETNRAQRASTAMAWPCGSARRMRIRSAATATPPFSSVRKPSTSAVGQAERLARVRFLTRPWSRKLSRNRMAGGEPRLGTDSIYMALFLALNQCVYQENMPITWLRLADKNQSDAAENLRFMASEVKTSG
jgi:Transposase